MLILCSDSSACGLGIIDIMFSRMRHICRTQYLKQAARCFSSPIAAPLSSPTSAIVKNLAKQDSSKMLFVTWNDNSVNRYPYIYLRDNCPCPKCFHADSMQRSFDVVADVDLDVVADDVEVLQNGEQVSVVWPDKHVSVYNSEWLHKRRLPEEEETGANDGSCVMELNCGTMQRWVVILSSLILKELWTQNLTFSIGYIPWPVQELHCWRMSHWKEAKSIRLPSVWVIWRLLIMGM